MCVHNYRGGTYFVVGENMGGVHSERSGYNYGDIGIWGVGGRRIGGGAAMKGWSDRKTKTTSSLKSRSLITNLTRKKFLTLT